MFHGVIQTITLAQFFETPCTRTADITRFGNSHKYSENIF